MKLKTFFLAIFCIISVNCFSQCRIKKDGSVKISLFNSWYGSPRDTSIFKLNVDGSICCTDNWPSLDINQKWKMGFIDGLLDKLLKINGKIFISADPKTLDLYYDFNAREVKEECPDLVRESGDLSETLAMNYDGFIPLLLGAVREQQNMINELRGKIGNTPDGENNNQAKDVHFTVRINLNFPDDNSSAANVNDSDSAYYDQAILKLPQSYSASGAPTRLVYYAHGVGSSRNGMVTANSWFPKIIP